MFREVTRTRQALSAEECQRILKQELRGVLSLNGDDGYPYGLPLNHYYNEEDGCLYFHGGKSGYKIEAICRDPKASFCVFDEGYVEEDDWARHISSVIVFGRIEFVEDQKVLEDIARKLSLKFTNDENYIQQEIDRSGERTLMFRLVPEHITGKIVTES